MKPPFELNRMNVLRVVSTLARSHRETNIFPVVLKNGIRANEEEIRKVMDELVSFGLFTKEHLDFEEELGGRFTNHFGRIAYKLAAKDFFIMDGLEILEEGTKFEEEGNLDVSEILYNILLDRDKKDYHALFCMSRLKRKKGIFDSGLINSTIEQAKKQKASNDVLDLMNKELKLTLSMLQNKGVGQETSKIKFNEEGKYRFKVIYVENKTSSAKLEGNTIVLKISSLIPEEYQLKSIDSLKRRVMNKIERGILMPNEKKLKDFSDGDKIKVDEHEYSLKIFFEDKKSSSARLDRDTIKMWVSGNLSEEEKKIHINDLIRQVVSKHRLPKLRNIIEELNKEHFNVKVNDIKFKKQMTKWGSCSSNGNINISYRLLFAPDDVLNYVSIHELAHLIQPNHSKNFWEIIRKIMPNYKEKIEWLKKHGGGLGL